MEKFLIRLMTWEENKDYPTMIRAIHSEKITELLNFYLTIKSKDLTIDIPPEDEYDTKFDNKEAYINDIRITFGGVNTLTCLDIYVEVI